MQEILRALLFTKVKPLKCIHSKGYFNIFQVGKNPNQTNVKLLYILLLDAVPRGFKHPEEIESF